MRRQPAVASIQTDLKFRIMNHPYNSLDLVKYYCDRRCLIYYVLGNIESYAIVLHHRKIRGNPEVIYDQYKKKEKCSYLADTEDELAQLVLVGEGLRGLVTAQQVPAPRTFRDGSHPHLQNKGYL